MDESRANSARETGRAGVRTIELSEDELEHVVGGLQRTWIEPRTASEDSPTVKPGEEATPVGASRAR